MKSDWLPVYCSDSNLYGIFFYLGFVINIKKKVDWLKYYIIAIESWNNYIIQ